MVKISFYILPLIFLANSCSNSDTISQAKSDSLIKKTLSATNVKISLPDSFILISAGQMSPYTTINIDQINFQLVIDPQGDTSFIGTSDKSFLTPEGYHIGMRWPQIKLADRNRLRKEPGWGYHIEFPSKWNLLFVEGQTTTDHEPTDTSKVCYIFKRY